MPHFSSASDPFFFKVLLHDFHEKLGGYFFEDGWQRFVDDHHLNEADLLVFEYEGFLQFSVKLFDSITCEKEYPPSTRKTSEECIIGNKFDEPPTTSPSAMNGFRDKREITVGDPEGREWQLKISHCRGKQRNQRFFYGNWLNFARVNGLEVGDVCSFEYNPSGEKDIMNIIPNEFINSQCLKKRDELYLRDPIGTLWKVEIFHKHEPVIRSHFSTGWPQFANGNCLKVGDVCVFEIDEDQEDTMNVYIDKKTSGCEKEYPPAARRRGKEHKSRIQVDVHLTSSPNGYTEGASDDKIKSNKWTRENSQLKNDMEIDGVYQQDGLSFFVATMKPANINYSYMNIPFKFSALNGFRKKQEIIVRDPGGREWQLKISGSGNNWHFRGGWLNLAGDKGLEVGDGCIFEFNPKGDHNIMDLRIVKKKSKPNHCEKDTSPSVQKNSEEHKTEYKIKKKHPSGCTKQGSWLTVSMNAYNIHKSYMYIPVEFAASSGFQNRNKITLRDPEERLWEMQIFNHFYPGWKESQFGGMWLQFVKVNGLEVGDTCLFLNTSDREEIMDVRIIKY
ncbi:B3 domain-containing protein [Acorus calamus]|uniref:B3 domain-containing protein n=1 Tax=Acorus calamus TaxID=4465 RepID=A0AAV9BZF9_ACOCL|nr:B3 domain-containing protein [Acorus calamus]